MRTSQKFTRGFYALLVLSVLTLSALAADPGTTFPATSAVNDQKAGSILVYNIYTSSVTNFTTQNTRLSMTNTSATASSAVHVFFVDGATCSIADLYVCLTPNQTITFLGSDLDPGITGYIVAVAVDAATGCPVNHNFLIGDLYVKLPSGHAANLGAEAFAARFSQFTGCGGSTSVATLYFDDFGVTNNYNSLPRVLAVDNIAARPDGNNTLLIVNRIGGDLSVGASPIGAIFGLLYDDIETSFSFSFTTGACQYRSTLSNTFPRTAPRFESVIPAGRSGWMRIWADNASTGLLGAAINTNPNDTTLANAFNSGHNLHKLTLNGSGAGTAAAPSITIPIFPPSC